MNPSRRVIAVAALIATVALGGTMATPASASPVSVEPLAYQHSCADIGNDGTTKAVLCADLIDNGNGTFGGAAEGVCVRLSDGAYVQCAHIHIYVALETTDGQIGEVGEPQCGHEFGDCPHNDRFIRYTDTLGISGCHDYWTVVFAGSYIQLPGVTGEGFRTLSANLGSGHTIICG